MFRIYLEWHSESKSIRNIWSEEKRSHGGNPSLWAQPNKTPQDEKETHSEEHIAKEHSTFLKKKKPTPTQQNQHKLKGYWQTICLCNRH